MAILFFKLECLFLTVFFVKVLLCIDEMNNCSQSIKIYKAFDCIHRFEDIQSRVRVYCNATLVQDLHKNTTQHQTTLSRLTSVNLVAYPVLIAGSPRYTAHFCIEVYPEDLIDVDSIFLIFSTREGNDIIRKSAVVHSGLKSNGQENGKYVRIGCYWHYIFLLATCEITVHLDVTLLRRNGSSSYGKYYFRIPFWEWFNYQKDVDPCLFAPFAYAEEGEGFETEFVFVGSVNCSRPAIVKVEQKTELSGELVETETIRTDEFGRGNTIVKYSKVLHYYEASFADKAWEDIRVSDESASTITILISVLVLVIFIVLLAAWCHRLPLFTSRNSVFYLEKPCVKFVYCNNSKYRVYRTMAETLILFMEKYCDIIISEDSIDFYETSKASLLPEKFDVVALIPFPATEEINFDDSCTIRSIKQWEGRKIVCVIMELPFWSGKSAELEELCGSFAKWKRFKLMDEFLPLLSHIQSCRSRCRGRSLRPVDAAEIQRKLEENNLTNDGFSFCLNEAFGDVVDEYASPPTGFPNLQEMEI